MNTTGDGHEVDFAWPDRRLVVEIDGGGHRRPRTKREDAANEAVLRAAGTPFCAHRRRDPVAP